MVAEARRNLLTGNRYLESETSVSGSECRGEVPLVYRPRIARGSAQIAGRSYGLR